MLSEIKTKIRALTEDLTKTKTDSFIYTISNIFTLSEDKGITILDVQVNGSELESGQSYFDADTAQLTIEEEELTINDIVTIKFSYYKYSDNELNDYIRSALVWMSIFSEKCKDFELENDTEIVPTPDNRTTDLMAIVASILIKPDYSEYRLPNLTVRYPIEMPKDKRIEELIAKYDRGLGINDIIEWDNIN